MGTPPIGQAHGGFGRKWIPEKKSVALAAIAIVVSVVYWFAPVSLVGLVGLIVVGDLVVWRIYRPTRGIGAEG